jgi:hypothetical protein
MIDPDTVVRILPSSLDQIVKNAKSEMFYAVMVAIREIQESKTFDPEYDDLCTILELKFKDTL